MPIKLDCPFCKQMLSVPRKKAGSQVRCPRCRGLLRVPEQPSSRIAGEQDSASLTDSNVEPPSFSGESSSDASWLSSEDSSDSSSSVSFRAGPAPLWNAAPSAIPQPPAVGPGGPSAPPVQTSFGMPAAIVPPSESLPPVAAPPVVPAVSPEGPQRMPPLPPPPAVPRGSAGPVLPPESLPIPSRRPAKKVARLIPAEIAVVTIQPSPDGKLPELHLTESEKPKAAEAKSGTRPLLLALGFCLSLALSAAMMLVDYGPGTKKASARKSEAQAYVQNYFSNMDKGRPLEPYQLYLREAMQAHTRGDRKTEKEMYRRVLKLLRAERDTFQRGLTGSQAGDRSLEERIAILLSDD